MMIRRNTWLLIILLLALVGFFFAFRSYKTRQAAQATPTAPAGGAAPAPLFGADLGAPTDISVKDAAGNLVEIARNPAGLWVLKAPTEAAADQASAEAAATQATSLQVLSSYEIGLDIAGLDPPSYTLSFTFSDGKTHSLKVGALTPIQDGYYTSLDGGPVRIVDKQGIESLLQLASQPPFAATPEPPVAPTVVQPSPTAPIELSATPAGGPPATATDTAANTPPAPTSTP